MGVSIRNKSLIVGKKRTSVATVAEFNMET